MFGRSDYLLSSAAVTKYSCFQFQRHDCKPTTPLTPFKNLSTKSRTRMRIRCQLQKHRIPNNISSVPEVGLICRDMTVYGRSAVLVQWLHHCFYRSFYFQNESISMFRSDRIKGYFLDILCYVVDVRFFHDIMKRFSGIIKVFLISWKYFLI